MENQKRTNESYVKELKACYTEQAEHFHHTRKKFWPEVDYIRKSIHKHFEWDSISLVDLGCWTWRLSERLKQIEWVQSIDYIWVDIAQWMISCAQENYPGNNFECSDMIAYLEKQWQESIDCVVWLASIQHIKWSKEQLLLMQHIYKSLKRWGTCILVNWSFSQRFIGKYWKYILQAIWRSLYKKWWVRNDLLLPRKDKSFHKNWKKYDRMYHIYTLHELTQLAKLSWFVVEEAWYVFQDGTYAQDKNAWKLSRNSFIVLKKVARKTA